MSCSSTPSSATGCAPRSRRRRQTPGYARRVIPRVGPHLQDPLRTPGGPAPRHLNALIWRGKRSCQSSTGEAVARRGECANEPQGGTGRVAGCGLPRGRRILRRHSEAGCVAGERPATHRGRAASGASCADRRHRRGRAPVRGCAGLRQLETSRIRASSKPRGHGWPSSQNLEVARHRSANSLALSASRRIWVPKQVFMTALPSSPGSPGSRRRPREGRSSRRPCLEEFECGDRVGVDAWSQIRHARLEPAQGGDGDPSLRRKVPQGDSRLLAHLPQCDSFGCYGRTESGQVHTFAIGAVASTMVPLVSCLVNDAHDRFPLARANR